mgnify:CR=1 FL=1
MARVTHGRKGLWIGVMCKRGAQGLRMCVCICAFWAYYGVLTVG